MAAFYGNSCTYPNCGRKFTNQPDLIYHIEDDHIDFDPTTIEHSEKSRPTFVPMSYVLRYSSIHPRPEPASRSEEQSPLDSDDSSYNGSSASIDIKTGSQKKSDGHEMKRLECPIPGCNKAYKNNSGMKYHMKKAHEEEKHPSKRNESYKCWCGRSFKTYHRFKSHNELHKKSNSNERNTPKADWYEMPSRFGRFESVSEINLLDDCKASTSFSEIHNKKD